MKRSIAPAAYALFTALCVVACSDNKSDYPKNYLGFERSTENYTYDKKEREIEYTVKIIAVNKEKEDRTVTIESPQKINRPGLPSADFFRIETPKIMIKANHNSAHATIRIFPEKIGINDYIRLTCRPTDKKGETSSLSIRLLKK